MGEARLKVGGDVRPSIPGVAKPMKHDYYMAKKHRLNDISMQARQHF
jgi:hypothetical protein